MMIGRTISHYEILGKLGEGGMGVVYRARDTKLDRDVALKFLPAGLTGDEESRKRFVREAKAAAALSHPNICAVHEIGESEGHTFIVMPCIEGAGLAGRLKDGPLPVDEALDIAIQVGKGLAKAHRNDIVHRDIKPGNILLTEDGDVKIVDFGLAKLGAVSKMTIAGTTLGTVGYMSPEQARGDEVDRRTDIWALGVVLYEMLSGSMPFRGEVDAAVIYSIVNEEPEPLMDARADLPEDLATIIDTALAKDPDGRYQSIGEMVEALEAVRVGKMPPVRRGRPAGSGMRTGRRALLAGAALIVVAAAVIGYIMLRPGETVGSVAVLPLMDLSGGGEDGGFADGITGALINELGQIRDVRWTSLLSVMRFKDSDMTVAEFCRKLGVDAAVVGSVQRDSTKVHLMLQLVDADSERQLWAESYDDGIGELPSVYGRIALDLAQHLRIDLNPEAAAAMVSRRSVDPDAHDAYLKGTYFLRNLNDLDRALTYFSTSIEHDPTFANAWAGLAETYIRKSHGATPLEGAVEKAIEAVDRALELDATLGEAYLTRAHILWEHTWDQEGAREAFRKGFEFNRSHAYGTLLYAYCLETMGRFEEAAETAIRATKLDPLSYFLAWGAFEPIAIGGRIDDAVRHIENTRELFPDRYKEHEKHFQLSLVYLYGRQYDRAIAEYHTGVELHEKSEDHDSSKVDLYQRWDAFNLARINSLAGNGDEADRLWTEYAGLTDLDEAESKDPFSAATYHIWHTGDLDKAFEILDRAFEEKNMWLTRITVFPWFEPLRGDPRYDRLVKGMGLV
jgi:TolB-like protein